MIFRALVVGMLVAGSARAETWADEPALSLSTSAEPEPVTPFLGLTAGVHLLLGLNLDAPAAGVRLGLRVLLGSHAALSVIGMYELAPNADRQGMAVPSGHLLHAVVRLEGFNISAFERLLVPELTVGLFAGGGAGFVDPAITTPSFLGGIHFGLTRLRPSGWWFPFFVEVGMEFFFGREPAIGLWRLGVGVGI